MTELSQKNENNIFITQWNHLNIFVTIEGIKTHHILKSGRKSRTKKHSIYQASHLNMSKRLWTKTRQVGA